MHDADFSTQKTVQYPLITYAIARKESNYPPMLTLKNIAHGGNPYGSFVEILHMFLFSVGRDPGVRSGFG